MKVLLTYASIDAFSQSDTDWDYEGADSHYPLGLAYLHSYLESLGRGYEVKTEFLNNVPTHQCLEVIKKDIDEFKPDVVGVSLITHSRVGSYRVIEMVQRDYPHIKIVIGGMHVSVMYRQLAGAYPGIVCVVGEGEITLAELVERWEKDLPIDDVTGIAFHNGEKVVVTPSRELIQDLDILPFPKHEIFLWRGRKVAGLLTSRGCPYKCNFCVLDATSRRKVRCRSAKNIIDEVEYIITNYPTVETVWLHDDAFMILKDRTMEFCQEVIRRGVKTNFICSARFRPISREVVMLMKQAGFVHVLFGLESGAPNVLKQMRKGITQKSARHGLKLFSETGIKATAFLIVGLPGESAETIDETIEFVQELQDIQYLYYDDIGVAGIYPGTELNTIAQSRKMEIEGYGPIDDDYWLTDGDVPFYEVDHTYEQLSEWKTKIRDAVALRFIADRPENFLMQRKVMASIIEYAWRWNLSGFVERMVLILNQPSSSSMAPLILRSGFIGEKNHKALNYIRTELEKWIIKSLFDKMETEERKAFIEQYNKQVDEDRKTIARWHETQRVERSGMSKVDAKENYCNDYEKAVINKDGTLINPVPDSDVSYMRPLFTDRSETKNANHDKESK